MGEIDLPMTIISGFAKANNQAFEQATGNLVLLLNPDTEVQPGAIKTLIDFTDSHCLRRSAIVAPQLLNTDGSVRDDRVENFLPFIGMVYELIGLSKMFPDNKTFGRYKMLDWNHDDTRQSRPTGRRRLSAGSAEM